MIRRARRQDLRRVRVGPSLRRRSGPFGCTSIGDPPDVSVIGYAIPRSTGTAVERNRLRRQMRAVCMDLDRRSPVRTGTHLLTFRGSCADMGFSDVAEHIQSLMVAP